MGRLLTFKILFIFHFSLFIFLVSCKKEDKPTPAPQLTYLNINIPDGWPQPAKDIFAGNPLTEEGFQLGRKLFYDGRLSKDGNFPCASCHQQFAAFATFDHQFSHGFDNTFTTRNAPELFNIAWMNELNWDGGAADLIQQSEKPITAHNEMAETFESILNKLKDDTSYKRLLKSAFGDEAMTKDRMLKALAQFSGSIQSYNSKYDKVKKGEATFTASEQNGYAVFIANCNTCHKEPLFTDNSFRNNGLALNEQGDKGRMMVTKNPADSLKFRVPSLRNVALTYPYMHDGRLYYLNQVINHYRTDINTSDPGLDPLLKNRITMTETERLDLVAFLNTLTDDQMLTDKRFQQP